MVFVATPRVPIGKVCEMSGEIVEQVLELLKVVMEGIVKMMGEVSIKLV